MDPSKPQLVNLLLSRVDIKAQKCVEIEARIRGEIANPISIRKLLCHTDLVTGQKVNI